MTVPTTMRAVVMDRFGPPDVLHLTEVPVPRPGRGEVLVRVHAAGVNAIDWLSRAGGLARTAAFPMVLGWDISGVVAASGPDVSSLREGDEVFGMIRFPELAGGYAEYVSAPAEQLVAKPGTVDHRTAAGTPMAGITAWQALFRQAQVTQGQQVLVHGAAGGVGHVAVQLAKLAGARVVATASARNHAFLASLGVDQTIDYTSQPIERSAAGLDVVLEPRGGADFHALAGSLRPGGIIVTLKGEQPDYRQRLAALGVRAGYVYVSPDREALTDIARHLGSGELKIYIDRVLPLDQAAVAHATGERGHVRGKLVLDVTDRNA